MRRLHKLSLGLLLGAGMNAIAVVGGAGPAQADPVSDPSPGIIDVLLTSTPALSANSSEESGSSPDWGGVGMYCENPFVRCR